MTVSITVTGDNVSAPTIVAVAQGDNVDGMIADLKRIFPALLAGTGLPPMQEQPKRDEPAPAKEPKQEILEPVKEKATRKSKVKEPETIEGTAVDFHPALVGLDAKDALEVIRGRLKTLGATDGLGHDKVFEVLGKYGAKNASTVPVERYAQLIIEVDALVEGAK